MVRRSARRLFKVALLPVFALTLVAAMWAAVTVQIGLERQASHADAVAQSQALARVLAEHVNYILRQSDHATQLFKLRYEASGGSWRLAGFGRRGGLLDSVLPARLDLPMALLDRNGMPVDTANGYADASQGEEAFFRAIAASDADLALFSTPVLDLKSLRWQIRVARRLNNQAGQFDGAIVILIDPYLFVDDYDRLDLADNGAVILTSTKSALAAGRAGERLFSSASLIFDSPRGADASSDELQPRVPLDDVARIYSRSDMPRYGLAAVVGVESSVALAGFERHRRLYLGIAAVVSLLILAVAAILMKQSMQLRASMRAAQRAQATLRAAAEGSLDGVLILRAWPGGKAPVEDFIFDEVNDKAAAMLGRERAQLLGQKAFTLLPRFRLTGFLDRYVQAYTEGKPIEEEVELRIEGDAPRWIHHQIVPLQDGVAVTSRDITARKLADIEIRNNRNFLQSLIAHLPLLICVKSVRAKSYGAMMVWNKAAESVTGYSADDVIGHTDREAFPPGFVLCNADQDRAMLADPKVVDLPEQPFELPDGSQRYLHTIAVPLLGDKGKTEFILCIAEDITSRREQEQTLRASEAHLTAVTNASPLGLVRTDVRGSCTYVNKRFETITGLTREQSLGTGWLAAFVEDQSEYMPAVFAHQRQHEEPFVRITRCRHTNGKLIWAATKIAAIRINGRIEGFVGTIDDITTLREAEMALRESEARLRTIADTLPTMVAYIDAGQVYRFQNRAYELEFGRGRGQVLGRSILETIGEARFKSLEPYILRALAGETLTFEEHDDQDGGERTLEVTYIPQSGDEGVAGFHVMRQDITSQKHEKKRLLKLAQVDALTGLANRAGFMLTLAASMQQSVEEGRLMALMYMDIDHFKPVNDTYGHQVGDALLKAFSARLVQTLRASDTIARLGGDEFTIIMEKLARVEDASNLADKIVKAMQLPFDLGEVTVSVSVSIGLAFFRDGEIDPDTLIREADRLLYQAKQAGRNTFRMAA
ncbi:MAG: PAS domain S-box protein [Pseudomonadota bacterium]